jgi:hypothetical protein
LNKKKEEKVIKQADCDILEKLRFAAQMGLTEVNINKLINYLDNENS